MICRASFAVIALSSLLTCVPVWTTRHESYSRAVGVQFGARTRYISAVGMWGSLYLVEEEFPSNTIYLKTGWRKYNIVYREDVPNASDLGESRIRQEIWKTLGFASFNRSWTISNGHYSEIHLICPLAWLFTATLCPPAAWLLWAVRVWRNNRRRAAPTFDVVVKTDRTRSQL